MCVLCAGFLYCDLGVVWFNSVVHFILCVVLVFVVF